MLIDKDYIKANSVFTLNAVNSTLDPHVRTAERLHIRPVLGVDLYNDLVAKCAARPEEPLTPEYAALLEKVQPALVQWMSYEALPFQLVKLTSIGANTRVATEAEAPSIETLKWMQENLRKTAESLTQDLVDFLNGNSGDYPLFQKDDCSPTNPGGRRIGGIRFLKK